MVLRVDLTLGCFVPANVLAIVVEGRIHSVGLAPGAKRRDLERRRPWRVTLWLEPHRSLTRACTGRQCVSQFVSAFDGNEERVVRVLLLELLEPASPNDLRAAVGHRNDRVVRRKWTGDGLLRPC